MCVSFQTPMPEMRQNEECDHIKSDIFKTKTSSIQIAFQLRSDQHKLLHI